MVSPITGLPPTILNNLVQEIESGTTAKSINQESSQGQRPETTTAVVNKETAVTPKETTVQQAEQPKEDATKSVDYSKLAEIVKTTLGNDNVDIQYKMDKDVDMMVMQVVDSSSKEVLKQFPPEITLKIAKIVAKLMETTGQVTNAQV